MAALSENDRVAVWSEFMRTSSATGCLKAQLRSVINAIDDWCEANATSFNNAIPQPMRGTLTQKEKALLLVVVVIRRHLVT